MQTTATDQPTEPVYTTNITFFIHYNNGVIVQLDKDVTYGTLEREKIEAVEVYKNEKLIFQMFLEPGQKLIYRRRVQLQPGNPKPFAVYILGWRILKNIHNKNGYNEDIQSINFIYEDNDIIQQLPRFREDMVLYSKPQFEEFENK